MPGGGDVRGWRTFSEHLLNGVSGNEMDQKEDQGHDEPDDWERIEHALEEGLQAYVLISLSTFSLSSRAESNDPYPRTSPSLVGILRLLTIVRNALGRASLGMTGLKKLVSISALLRSFSFGIG